MSNDIQTSILKNAGVMFVSQFVTWTSSFVLLLFLPRYLGSVDYGHLFLALSLSMILRIVVDFGGNYLIPKRISRSPNEAASLLSSYIGIRIILWLFGIIILWLFSLIAGYSSLIQGLIIILGVSTLWSEIRLAYRSYFQGIESMEYPSVGVIAEKVFISIFAIAALLMGFHSITIALIMAGGALLDLIICMHFAHRFLPKFPRFNWHDSVNLLKKSLPYFLWSVFAVIYYRIDAVMLSLMTADKVVGWYGGAYRFFDVFMFFPSILTTVIFPIFSRLSISKVNQLADVLHKGFKYLLLFGVLIGIMVFFFSKQIVIIFLGLKGYTPSIIILKVFAFGVPLVYIDFILGNAIIAADKQRQWAFIGFIAIFINILLNYFLIRYTQFSLGNGGIGAAIATLVTELYIMISSFILIPASYSNGIKINLIFKIIVTGGLTAGVIWAIQSTQVFWLLSAIVGSIIYGVSSIKLNVITQNELRKVHSFLSTNNLKSIVFQRNLN